MPAQLHFHHRQPFAPEYQNNNDTLYADFPPPWPYTKVKRSAELDPVNNQYNGYTDLLPMSGSKPNGAPSDNPKHIVCTNQAAPANGNRDNAVPPRRIDLSIPTVDAMYFWNPAFPNNHRAVLEPAPRIILGAPLQYQLPVPHGNRVPQPSVVHVTWSPELGASQQNLQSSPSPSSSSVSSTIERVAELNMDAPGPSSQQYVPIDLSRNRNANEKPKLRSPDPKPMINGASRHSTDPQGAVSVHVERQPGMIEDLTNKYKWSRTDDDKRSNIRISVVSNQASFSSPRNGSGNLKENIESSSEQSGAGGLGLSMPSVQDLFGESPPKPSTSNGRPKPPQPSTSKQRETKPDPSERLRTFGPRKLVRKVKPWSNPSAINAIANRKKMEEVPATPKVPTISIPDAVPMDESSSTVSVSDNGVRISSSIISIPDNGAIGETFDSISISSGKALDAESSRIRNDAHRFSPPSKPPLSRKAVSRTRMREERKVNNAPIQSEASTSKASRHASPPSTVLPRKAKSPEPKVEPIDVQDPSGSAPGPSHDRTERVEEARAETNPSRKSPGANPDDNSRLDNAPSALVPYRAPPRSPKLPKLCYIRPADVAEVPRQTRHFNLCRENMLEYMLAFSACEFNGYDFICSHCSKAFKSPSKLKEHLGRVSKFLPYTCKLCGFKCVTINRATKHIEEYHALKKNEGTRR